MSDAIGVEAEAHWGPPELLADVQEMLRYWRARWIGWSTRLREEPLAVGRLESDPLRIAVIARDRTLPTGELYARIAGDAERIRQGLERLTPDDTRRRGIHLRYGATDVTAIVDRHIVDHVDRHVQQLRAILGSGAT